MFRYNMLAASFYEYQYVKAFVGTHVCLLQESILLSHSEFLPHPSQSRVQRQRHTSNKPPQPQQTRVFFKSEPTLKLKLHTLPYAYPIQGSPDINQCCIHKQRVSQFYLSVQSLSLNQVSFKSPNTNMDEYHIFLKTSKSIGVIFFYMRWYSYTVPEDV